MKKLIIRADGNSQIGAGHIMRCLSVAVAARNQDVECVFVTADDSFSKKIAEFGFKHIVLNSMYNDLSSEIELFEQTIKNENANAVLLDSYFVTKEYLGAIKKLTTLCYIDDVYSFAYDVDLLINYNIYADLETYKSLYLKETVELPKTALGLDYVPLREKFQNIAKRKIESSIKNIMVSVGGADPECMAIKIAQMLLNYKNMLSCYNFHFVIGAFEPDKEALKTIANKNAWILLHENITKMSALMLQCDVAIAAAGSTLYELCTCGVPTLTYILADNQIQGAKTFEKKGLMLNVGDIRSNNNFEDAMYRKLELLIKDSDSRKQMSERQQCLIDGNGANKIADKIYNFLQGV